MAIAPTPPLRLLLDLSQVVVFPRTMGRTTADSTLAMTTPAVSGFLCLPYELRDMVYREYFAVEGGYAHNPHTDKLRRRAGEGPIDLDLTLTCKRIAGETRGLALGSNTITFRTVGAEDEATRARARLFDVLMQRMHRYREHMLYREIRTCITDQSYDTIVRLYPQFAPVMAMVNDDELILRAVGAPGPWGQPPSLYREFVQYALQVICFYNHRFARVVSEALPSVPDPVDLVYYRPPPWAIPRRKDLKEMECVLGTREKGRQPDHRGRFSAAAAAIRFVESRPRAAGHMRRLVLEEDYPAVSNPECHGLSFVPICQEYPLLRVERRVNLWTAVFPDICTSPRRPTVEPQTVPELDSNRISEQVATWVVEAAVLQSAGMPPGSFSLVLTGDPAPRLCSDIFQTVIHRDVAWQLAQEECLARGHLSQQCWGARTMRPAARRGMLGPGNVCYLFDGFPRALRDIVDGGSVVRCEFDPGEPLSVEALLQGKRGWLWFQWQEGWYRRDKQVVETFPELAPFVLGKAVPPPLLLGSRDGWDL
ncbi:hypothetical protein EsH8_VI_000823 [Colletotrichum jinshuiense]